MFRVFNLSVLLLRRLKLFRPFLMVKLAWLLFFFGAFFAKAVENKEIKQAENNRIQKEEVISEVLQSETLQSEVMQSESDRNPASQNRIIKNIVIKGNNFISSKLIQSHLKVKKGESWSSDKIQKDVQQLFSLNFFEDIQVEGIPDKKKRWTLIYKVKERIFISSLEFKGNKKLNDKELKEEAFVEEYSFLDPHKLEKTFTDIKKKYKEKAYYLVELSYRLETDEENKKAKKLIITINENKKLYIKKIQIIGNRNISSQRLKAFLKSKEKNLISFLTSQGVYQPEFIEHDRQMIEYYYRNEGYLNVKVQPPVISISADKTSLFLNFEISEGNRFKMGRYFLKEEELIDKQNLFKLSGKKHFSLGALQQDIQLISNIYKNKGHALVKVKPLFYPDDLEEDKIHIGFQINKGRIYKIGKILIRGNKNVRDKVIFRRFHIKEGDTYKQDQINLTQQLLEQLAVFEKVSIIPTVPNETVFLDTSVANKSSLSSDSKNQGIDNKTTAFPEVHLQTIIKERENTGEASLVGGYNSYTKLFIQGGVKKENFLGLEQNISVKVNLGYYDETMVFYYQNPYFLDSSWNFGFELFNLAQQSYVGAQLSSLGNLFGGNDYRTYFSLDTGFSVSVGRKLGSFSSLFLKYRFSDQRISEETLYLIRKLPVFSSIFGAQDTKQTTPYTALENRSLSKETLSQLRFNDIYNFESATGLKSSLSLVWEQDKRNDRFYATKGFFTRFTAEYTGLGGSLKYSKLIGDFRHYYNPLWKFVLKNRVDLGWVFSTTKNREVPFTELFLLGGSYNLRGFLANSQGPKKKSEDAYQVALAYNEQQTEKVNKISQPEAFSSRPYGGSQKLFYSLELEAPIVERAGLRTAIFLDLGESNNGLSFNLNDQLRVNVGFGLRWVSPFGPLSLDWAIPYKPRKAFEESPWQFQFSVGSVL